MRDYKKYSSCPYCSSTSVYGMQAPRDNYSIGSGNAMQQPMPAQMPNQMQMPMQQPMQQPMQPQMPMPNQMPMSGRCSNTAGECASNQIYLPYYQMYGYPQTFMEEQENERDMERLKEMYPEMAKEIMIFVEDECDKMEYEGSVMFDERPDQVMLSKIRDNIYDKVKGKYDVQDMEDRDEIFVMNRETRRRYPPRKNWLNDVIEIMLFQEMYRRRCRHRNCRRWY